MSLSDIRTRVEENLDRDDLTDTQLNRWINDAQRFICRAHNFSFMETECTSSTVDGQRSYALPDDFKSEINCELIDSDDYRVPLTKAHKQDIENKWRYRDTDDPGEPRHYAIQDGQIHLYPEPGHSDNDDTAWTINFEYYGYLDDLSGDSDTNDLIDNHPEVVELIATAYGFRYDHDHEKYRVWLNDGVGMLQAMIQADNTQKFGSLEEGMAPAPGSSMGAGATRVNSLTRWMNDEDAHYS